MLYCDTYLLISILSYWLFGNLCCFFGMTCSVGRRPGQGVPMLAGPLLKCLDIGGSLTLMCKYLYCSD